jgi:hypothetical protein
MLSMGEGKIVGTHTLRNHVCRNHTTLQLKFLKNSYTTVLQLSLGYYNYYVIIPLEIRCINK